MIEPSFDKGRCLRREVRTVAGGAVPFWEGENIVNGEVSSTKELSGAGDRVYARGGHHLCNGDVERSRGRVTMSFVVLHVYCRMLFIFR
jgi:hypothetical protein